MNQARTLNTIHTRDTTSHRKQNRSNDTLKYTLILTAFSITTSMQQTRSSQSVQDDQRRIATNLHGTDPRKGMLPFGVIQSTKYVLMTYSLNVRVHVWLCMYMDAMIILIGTTAKNGGDEPRDDSRIKA